MAKLPQAHLAQASESKIVDYLLAPMHPGNGGKAAFFLGWGFTAAAWQVLSAALIDLAGSNDVSGRVSSPWGVKYIIEGTLQSPRGTTPPLRTVWMIDQDSIIPRLVTAYPVG